MMTLYSGTTCPFSQRCRIVLYEKGMDFQIIDVDMYNKPEDIAVMNPYNRLPVLVERDLILYEANIINEYIDERFPHPQLMPADPVMRARARLFLFRFEQELFNHVQTLESGTQKAQEKARLYIRENLIQIAPIFVKQKYMLGEDGRDLDQVLADVEARLLLGLLGARLQRLHVVEELLLETEQEEPRAGAHHGIRRHELRMREALVDVL